jgi:antitoxin YefM
MTNINATTLRKNLFGMLSNTIKYNEAINVSTKEGNAVILSEEEYNGMMATLELSASDKLKNKILAAKNEKLENCVSIDEVEW